MIRYHKEERDIMEDSISELLSKILVSSKLGLFRCRDLLEINTGAELKDLSIFKIKKATESITRIIELLYR